MALLSPSIARLERPIEVCARILNNLGCQSVHVDVYQGFTLPGFFKLEDVRESLGMFNGSVTMHLFQLKEGCQLDLSFLRNVDLAVFHVFPTTNPCNISGFLESAQMASCRSGLSIDLEVDTLVVEPYLPTLDTVFVMGIPVATCGLQPDKSTLERLARMRKMTTETNQRCRLGLDGGVNATTFTKLVTLVDELVVGSFLFNTDDLVAQWKELTTIAKGGNPYAITTLSKSA